MEPIGPASPAGDGNHRRPFLIENVYEKESSESFVERHFRGLGLHRCRSTAEFDVDAIATKHESALIRSVQETEVDPEGRGFRAAWAMISGFSKCVG